MKLGIKNILAVVGFLSIIIFGLFIYFVLNISNPQQSEILKKYDAIVILSGNPARAKFGSKLFTEHFSNVVLLSKEKALINDYRNPEIELMTYELYLEILMKNKVPRASIVLFGENNKSTFDEVKSLSDKAYYNFGNLLVVTNIYHIFRAKLIFNQLLPQKHIDFISPEFHENNTEWWKEKQSIQIIIIEAFKTIFFYIVGNFDNYLTHTP